MMSSDPTTLPVFRRHYCGCTSRTTTIVASCFLLILALFYLSVCVLALTDKSKDAPTPPERAMFILLLISMILQIIFSILSLWGACTNRGWPVRVTFVWVSICLIFNSVGMIVSMNLFLLIGILLQFLLFWMPLYGYIQDFSQSTATFSPSAGDVEYSDSQKRDTDMDNDGMELV